MMALLKVSLCFFILCMISCTSKDEEIVKSDSPILGKWQLSGALISAGGPAEWSAIDDGATYQFFEDGTFTSTHFSECTTGEYVLESGLLSLNHDCDGFESPAENEKGFITYDVVFENRDMLFTPRSVRCIEGCTYRLTRLDD